MQQLKLIYPTLDMEQEALDYRQEHIDCGETHIHGSGGFIKAEDYKSWLERITNAQTAEMPEGQVNGSTFFAVIGKRIVGTIQIRHKLNDFLLGYGGHIGYGVRPSERRKGYATEMLALALERCRELGIDRALVTCDNDNIGSSRTIIKNGGILENEVTQEDGSVTQRYWITVSPVKTLTGKTITLRAVRESDIDDRYAIGRHHEFVHMCGGESLKKPGHPDRSVWENWYEHKRNRGILGLSTSTANVSEALAFTIFRSKTTAQLMPSGFLTQHVTLKESEQKLQG